MYPGHTIIVVISVEVPSYAAKGSEFESHRQQYTLAMLSGVQRGSRT